MSSRPHPDISCYCVSCEFPCDDWQRPSAQLSSDLAAASDSGMPMRAGIAQLMGSLKAEAAQQGVPVGVHTLSPGMVLTNLLLEGASDTNKQARLPACRPADARSAQPGHLELRSTICNLLPDSGLGALPCADWHLPVPVCECHTP